MALDTNIKLGITCVYQKTLSDGSVVLDNFQDYTVLAMKTGVGADKADRLVHVQRTLSPGANENLDLYNVLLDAFGDGLNCTKIKFLAVINMDQVHTFTIKPAASNGFLGPFGAATHTLSIKPSNATNPSWLVLIADPNGYTVTDGTGDLFNVAMDAGGSAGAYQLIIVASTT